MPMEDLFALLGRVTHARLIERDDFSQRIEAGKPTRLWRICSSR